MAGEARGVETKWLGKTTEGGRSAVIHANLMERLLGWAKLPFMRSSVIVVLFLLAATAAKSAVADPRLASWQTLNSRRYARIVQAGSTTVETTWPTGITGQYNGGLSNPAYSDIQHVSYSATYVYVNATGLASYTMGPWYLDAAKTVVFPNWPADLGLLMRFPRSPVLATTHTTSGYGPIAMAVNGVVFYNGNDAYSYSSSSGTDAMSPQGNGIWNRDALLSEGATFDPSLAHQQNTGQYHYHVNPIGLRYQLGDHVAYTASTGSYAEATTPLSHSPILGWAFDGYPIYGPYGYSSPMDPTSGVRRMVSGFVKRDGTHGTTNLAATGRTTLPKWAVAAQGLSSGTLSATQAGPAVSTTRPVGYYQEDNDYLGDEGYTQGVDFDLNSYNARYCVTPDFPQGTWAYFAAIDASNQPAFPYTVGPQYAGVVSGGSVQSIAETVTQYARGGAAAPIAVTVIGTGSAAVVSWASVEGGSYLIEGSPDGSSWTTLASNVASGGATTSFTTSTLQAYYRVTLSALSTYDSAGSGAGTAIGGNAVGQLVGASGTAYLANLSALVPSGGAAGTPAFGLTVSGAGTKSLLLRAIGPTLANFGVTGAMADPNLTVYQGSTIIGANDNWNASLAPVFAAVGAFALPVGSKDAAIQVTASAGNLTGSVGATDGGSGTVLMEVYDTAPGTAPNLSNLSARGYVATGASVTAGFVVSGTGSVQVLLRGVGPALASLGVSGVLPDPALTLYQGSTILASNQGWSSAADSALVQAAAAQTGAFSLSSGSKDSAVLVTLQPGAYTLAVSGASGDAGTALAELYLVH